MIYPASWYRRYVSSPTWRHIRTQAALGGDTSKNVSLIALGGAVSIPHILIGSSKYLMIQRMRAQASRMAHILEIYNLSNWKRIQIAAGIATRPKGYSEVSRWFSPLHGLRKQQAVQAAKYLKFASRAVPVLGAAALAYDIYDITFNKSLWGIEFD